MRVDPGTFAGGPLLNVPGGLYGNANTAVRSTAAAATPPSPGRSATTSRSSSGSARPRASTPGRSGTAADPCAGVFGRLASGGNYFAGTLDEVAVYNTALSAGTIGNHYARR
jgi:hypothetical protein